MNPAYEQFKKSKDLDRERRVKDRSMITLHWYEKIGTLLNDPAYSASETFLSSVEQFIEEREYITDKQIEILERIERHPWGN